MKASEMICLLAKQIQLNGDREVIISVNTGECSYNAFDEFVVRPLSITKEPLSSDIEIYGE